MLEKTKQQTQDQPEKVWGYTFYTSHATLPAGRWCIQALHGNLWVFTGQQETVIESGNSFIVDDETPVVIRSLYRRGGAEFTAVQQTHTSQAQ
ncbi:hypothetical protein G4Y79_11305 [Phototrophicus methaneseepsis]|uniref:Uncharacterized protein n=1 Tax=Phototrophicus methaneseepsis TaxID=2710758 RepID=A0A7S8EDF8_9CHLR|nr:hypothetical protein [Phototrophicus methaneseepsis]QPC84924.1 hypothetical protein G4Y79_11305 [Phototrophicus methaneseepsis]